MRMYERFLRDKFAELNPDVILEEVEELEDFLEAKDKSEVYKENYYLRDNLQKPFITDTLAKRRVQDSIVEFTGRFLDEHANELSTSGPVYIITFSAKEAAFFYDLFKITADQLLEMYDNLVKETYFGNISKFITGWIQNAPHKLLITSILIDAVQHDYKDIIECCEYLWAFCEYPLIYREFWQTGVKEEVMNYTIEHLGSKYKVKQVTNLKELLKYDANQSVSFFIDAFKAGADNTYIDFMRRIHNQIKSKMRNIANEYYHNSETNATQHNNTTTFDDGEIADQEGHATNVAQVVDKTISKFTSGELNKSWINVAADGNSVDAANLSGYIAQIYATKDNRLNKFVENIITIYFSKNPTNTSVGSGEFMNFGLALYRSISTSKDPLLAEIKQILNKWMFEIIDIRSQYQREATVINYTRAIFNYMVFMIVYYN